jgi:hypothetical protein
LWFPSAFRIELANAFEQPVGGRIQVNCQFRYLITQFLDGKHGGHKSRERTPGSFFRLRFPVPSPQIQSSVYRASPQAVSLAAWLTAS